MFVLGALLYPKKKKKKNTVSYGFCKIWTRFPGGSDDIKGLPCRRPGFDLWLGKILWRRERLPRKEFLLFVLYHYCFE